MLTDKFFAKALSCLACPACRGPLHYQTDRVTCPACSAGYPIVDSRIIVFSQVKISTDILEKTLYGPEFDDLISQIPPAPKRAMAETVALDYGCGSSPEVFKLVNDDAMGLVFGLDYDLEPLQILARAASERGYPNIFLVQYDRDDLPFAEEVFDLVTSHQALEHVPEPGRVVCEISRRMKPGAIFRVDFPNGRSIGELLRELFHRLNRTRNPHISRISLQRAKGYFRDAGLAMEHFESTYALRGPLIYFIEGFVLRFLFRKQKIYAL
ncbi:MAG: methyltransferase domain-containing protein, partial [Desulfuromonadales bacterium]|nr:methyltransferase domain-containing protein [Desulfuromonadales bacterium]